MRILFDEGVNYKYQKEFKRDHPEDVVSNAQAMGWTGISEEMKGLSPEQKDQKLATLAKQHKVDVLITTDKAFHESKEVPTNVIVISPTGKHPTLSTLREYNIGVENELQIIRKEPDQKTERTIIDESYLKQVREQKHEMGVQKEQSQKREPEPEL